MLSWGKTHRLPGRQFQFDLLQLPTLVVRLLELTALLKETLDGGTEVRRAEKRQNRQGVFSQRIAVIAAICRA